MDRYVSIYSKKEIVMKTAHILLLLFYIGYHKQTHTMEYAFYASASINTIICITAFYTYHQKKKAYINMFAKADVKTFEKWETRGIIVQNLAIPELLLDL